MIKTSKREAIVVCVGLPENLAISSGLGMRVEIICTDGRHEKRPLLLQG